jgi:hypothetical protein
MSTTTPTSSEVKSFFLKLASQGNFTEIERRFGREAIPAAKKVYEETIGAVECVKQMMEEQQQHQQPDETTRDNIQHQPSLFARRPADLKDLPMWYFLELPTTNHQ